jgi:two-component system, LuxR family, sensor kinase FixL
MARFGVMLGWASQGWRGYALAFVSVGVALLARLGLETFGRFYYLPLIPAVMLPALLASRRATLLAIVLSIAANVALVPRESAVDAVVNALLFAAVGLAIGEVGRAQRALLKRSYELKAQLSRRDATLDALLASANVLTLDTDGRILAISPRAQTLFGVTEADVLARPIQALVDGFDPEALREGVVPANGVIHTWKGRRGDATFPLGVRGAFTNDEDGAPELVLMVTDLSLWHSAEARNQELNDQLSQVWRLNSLGEMAAILAHELNQPLTAAATYLHGARADMQHAGAIGENATRNLDLAKGQVLRAGGIIRRARQLLAVGARDLQVERVSSMLDDLQPILQLLGPAADVALRFEIDAAEDEVLADRIQFQQAVVNLVRNAVEAAGAGGRHGEVVISGRPVSDRAFEVRVEDNGAGVRPEQMTGMFRPLISTKAEGMGLGLSVTRSIVERHGGALRIERGDLGGAAFVFELIRAEAEDLELAAA